MGSTRANELKVLRQDANARETLCQRDQNAQLDLRDRRGGGRLGVAASLRFPAECPRKLGESRDPLGPGL
jgi:hypothetical protein